jgi:hypothetical protein
MRYCLGGPAASTTEFEDDTKLGWWAVGVLGGNSGRRRTLAMGGGRRAVPEGRRRAVSELDKEAAAKMWRLRATLPFSINIHEILLTVFLHHKDCCSPYVQEYGDMRSHLLVVQHSRWLDPDS